MNSILIRKKLKFTKFIKNFELVAIVINRSFANYE